MSASATVCPSCAKPMLAQSFGRKLGGDLPIDICPPCKLIWFDQYESLQLSPVGLLDMFKLIHAQQGDTVHPHTSRLNCPRCRGPLDLTHDVQRSTRFVYFRCASGHGRLTAFYQFLREKNFVRNLAPAEVAKLKAEVKQVSCSGCGAPINLESDSACSFCKAPVAVLDANAVQTALEGLLGADSQLRRTGVGLASVESMIAALEAAREERRSQPNELNLLRLGSDEGVPDLVRICVGLVANGFSK